MSQMGKRYTCTECGTAVLCLRPSADDFECCGQPMGELQMEEVPSGD